MNRLRRRARSGFSKGKQSSTVKYLKEISGYPLSVSNLLSLVELTVSGNATQDGTPSPDNPVEIQGCGDRTANLFDISDFASTSSGYVENGEVYVTGYPYQPAITPEEFLAMTGLQEGDTFTTYGDLQILGTGTNSLNIQFAPRDAGTSAGLNHVVLTNAGKSKTSTIPVGFNSTNYYSLYIYAGGGDGLRGIWRNLMVVKGAPDERPPYEPYGYKIPVEVSGRNLFDVHNLNLCMTTISSTGYTPKVENGIFYSGGQLGHASGKFPYIATDSKPITISFTISGETPTGYIYGFDGVDDDGIIVGSVILNTLSSNLGAVNFTYNGAKKYIGFCLYSENRYGVALSDIQILEGSYTAATIPPYEPYHAPQTFNVYMDKPLYATGDVGDEIMLDFEHKTATRTDKIRQLKDFGVSHCAGIPRQTEQCIHLSYNNVDEGGVDGSPVLSTHFVNVLWVPVSTDAQNEGIAWYPSGYNHIFYIYLNKTRIDMTADDTTATLATKCSAYIQTLTGREAYYQLLTPATTDISAMQDWDSLPELWKGSVLITAQSDVEPGKLNLKYYSSVE